MSLRPNAYHTILADPPWRYSAGPGRRAAADKHYRTMTVEEIKALGPFVRSLVHPDGAHLWLWVPNAFLVDGTAAAVCTSWGFHLPITAETWAKGRIEAALPADPQERTALWSKVRRLAAEAAGDMKKIEQAANLIVFLLARLRPALGQGVYLRGSTEHLILATCGPARLPDPDAVVATWFLASRAGHSEKPAEQYDVIERISDPPFVEIFARALRHGWDASGRQIDGGDLG